MTRPRPRPALTDLFTTGVLLTALGLPMSACAQAQAVEAQTPAAEQAEAETPTDGQSRPETDAAKDIAEDTAEADAEEQADPEPSDEQAAADEDKSDEDKSDKEKTPEELAAEAEQKELKTLQRQAQLRAAKLAAELAPLKEKKARIEAELSLLQTQQQDAQAKARFAKEQADFEAQLKLAELSRQLQQAQQEYQQMQLQAQIDALKAKAQLAELSATNAKLAAESAALQAELSLIQTQRSAASIDKDPMQYPSKPLDGKTLTISDRRIPLNGGITRGSADYVTERIHYFNNLNEEAPIFIVIDTNPGGSVMEGYRIVTAMQNSKAPVHVVVKSYAASMAAVITTLAEESYAYPNAIILHHQMSSSMRGNLTQQKEWLEEGFEWARRLADPVAEKMGVSYDEFVKQMYKNNSDGDWAEFADKAVKLKWVNHVVEEIRETALITAPVDPRAAMMTPRIGEADAPRPLSQHELFHSPITFETKVDGNGKTYTELPPLSPFDFYFLYDPENRYRIAQ